MRSSPVVFFPAGHAVHADAEAIEYESTAHAPQIAAVADENLPTGHVRHEVKVVAAVEFEYVPVRQSLHHSIVPLTTFLYFSS